MRGGFHVQKKLFGVSTIFKAGKYNYEAGSINMKGELSSVFLTEFRTISNSQSGNYFESTFKLFLGKENIQGNFGFTRLFTFHNLKRHEKNYLIYFGLSADIDNLYQGFRRKIKN